MPRLASLARGLLLEILGGLEPAIAPNVQDPHAQLVEHSRQQEIPMAAAGILLGTHQGGAVLSRLVHELTNAVTKPRALRNFIVPHVAARVVETVACWLTTELVPQKNVPQPRALDHGPQGCSVEMRGETRIGV